MNNIVIWKDQYGDYLPYECNASNYSIIELKNLFMFLKLPMNNIVWVTPMDTVDLSLNYEVKVVIQVQVQVAVSKIWQFGNNTATTSPHLVNYDVKLNFNNSLLLLLNFIEINCIDEFPMIKELIYSRNSDNYTLALNMIYGIYQQKLNT